MELVELDTVDRSDGSVPKKGPRREPHSGRYKDAREHVDTGDEV